jgi:hypothetical protein
MITLNFFARFNSKSPATFIPFWKSSPLADRRDCSRGKNSCVSSNASIGASQVYKLFFFLP